MACSLASSKPLLSCHFFAEATSLRLNYQRFPAANTLDGLHTHHVHSLFSPKGDRKEQHLLPCKAQQEFFPWVGEMAEERGEGHMVLPALENLLKSHGIIYVSRRPAQGRNS